MAEVDLSNNSRNSGGSHSKLMEARICSTTEAETKKTDAKTDTLTASSDNQRQQTHGERGRGAVQTNEDRHAAAGGNKCAHDASAHLNKEREKRASKSQIKRAKKKQQRNALAAEDEHENEMLAAAIALAAKEREVRVEKKMEELEKKMEELQHDTEHLKEESRVGGCSHSGCGQQIGVWEVAGAGLMRCKKCRQMLYCSKACQVAGWKAGHKQECERLRKGVGARAGTGRAATQEAFVQAADANGVTAIMVAAGKGHHATVEALAGLGADVQAANDSDSVMATKAQGP